MLRRTNTRAAQGSGTIRKKTVIRNGQEYSYWEARVTIGRDLGTGKQIQKSFTGKTQKEVRDKLQVVVLSVNDGTYQETPKITLGNWLDTWADEYLGDVKPFTVASYKTQINTHIKPALGAVKLASLTTHNIQCFYNNLLNPSNDSSPLSPKTIKNIHGVLHRALQQAVENRYIKTNPSDACKLPRIVKKDLKPLDELQMAAFMQAINGHRFEAFYKVTLFTGMREGEALGLLWDCVNFKTGTIRIDKQLQREKKKNGKYVFAPLKNDKARVITPAPWVMQLLEQQKKAQLLQRAEARELWEDTNLVFTNEVGQHLAIHTIYTNFKKIAASIGCPDLRVHDLRHSYAVASIRAGDDIKTVQGNLGHATAAFTLDIYGHVTDQMQRASAQRMENYIKDILRL